MMSIPATACSALASSARRLLRRFAGTAAALIATASLALPVQAGTIVVNGDEWTLSNTGYSQAGGSNADTFARNLIGVYSSGTTPPPPNGVPPQGLSEVREQANALRPGASS